MKINIESQRQCGKRGKGKVYFSFFNALYLAVFQSRCGGQLADAVTLVLSQPGEMGRKTQAVSFPCYSFGNKVNSIG
jgi:hypothetical protein